MARVALRAGEVAAGCCGHGRCVSNFPSSFHQSEKIQMEKKTDTNTFIQGAVDWAQDPGEVSVGTVWHWDLQSKQAGPGWKGSLTSCPSRPVFQEYRMRLVPPVLPYSVTNKFRFQNQHRTVLLADRAHRGTWNRDSGGSRDTSSKVLKSEALKYWEIILWASVSTSVQWP